MSGSRRSSFGSDRTYTSTNGRRSKTADFKEYKAAYISVLKNTNENITTRQQLTQVLQYAGKNPTVSQIAKIWSSAEGSISYEMICDILQDIKSTTRSQLISAFRKIDINGDGYISEAELYKVLTSKGEKMTKSEVKKILDAADSNKDGRLDYNEFCSMMLSTVNQCKQMNTQRLTALTQEENTQNLNRTGPVPSVRRSRPSSIQGSTVEEESPGFVSQISVRSSTSTSSKKDKSLIQKLDDAIRVKGYALNELKPKSQQPRSLKGWTHTHSKGCFYVSDKNIITSHIYSLELPTASNIWLTMKPYRLAEQEENRSSNVDVGIFIMRENDKQENELVSFIESKDNKHWFWRGDLRSGSYTLIPFTTGCRLKPRGFDQDDQIQLVKNLSGEVALSKACKDVLHQVFDLNDLDGNGRLSRNEFNFYQMMTSGEEVDDDAWQVVLDNFETEDEEMTKEGFLKLHLLQAQEDDVDPQEELMESLKSIGFNGTLDLDQACPFMLDAYSKDCKASLIATSLSVPEEEQMKNAIISGVTSKDDTLVLNCVDGLTWYILRTDFQVSTVLENKTLKMIEVQASCSQTKNCLTQRSKDNFTVKILPRSKTIVDHAVPAFNSEEWIYHCQLSHKPSKPTSRRPSASSRKTSLSLLN